MRAFRVLENPTSNGYQAMWYQPWQSGYLDILKRGFPKPSDDKTVLAELRSPQVDDFLHDGARDIPFLVTDRVRETLEKNNLSGFSFGPVVVAKIATKGLRKRQSNSGEPEDSILKSKGVSLDAAPKLFSVTVSGMIDVVHEHESGKTPRGRISPFRLLEPKHEFDLWQPSRNGIPFSSWAFCSDRFRSLCESAHFSNIKFVPFDVFMKGYSEELNSG